MENMVDSDYRGMDTGRLVHWRHRRREDPQWDMHHGTDHSHSHRPGEIKKHVHYKSILCHVSNYALCSILLHL